MRGLLGRYWHYVIVVGVVLVLNVLHVAQFTEFSPIDESRHLDYMIKLTDGQVVRLGDVLSNETMRLEACRGIQLRGFDEPSCTARRYVPEQFRDSGYNNAINHPPLYYAVTAAPAWLADELGAGNMFDPARLLGGIWLAAGLVLAMRAGELLGTRRVPLVAAAIALTVVPGIVGQHATINPDAGAVFAGGFVFLLAVLWERGAISMWWLGIAGVVAAGIKLTNLAAIAVVVLWFLVRSFARRRQIEFDDGSASTRDARAYLTGAGTILLSALIVSAAWIGIQGLRRTIDPMQLESNSRFETDSFPDRQLTERANFFSMMPPVGHNDFVARPLRKPIPGDIAYIGLGLSVTAMVAWALRFSVRDRLSTIGGATLLVSLLGGSAFLLFLWLSSGLAFQPSSRYATSLVPFIVVLLAGLVHGRVATGAIAGYSALATALVGGYLIFN